MGHFQFIWSFFPQRHSFEKRLYWTPDSISVYAIFTPNLHKNTWSGTEIHELHGTEKFSVHADLWDFTKICGDMKSDSYISIPNFIFLLSPLKNPVFSMLCGYMALRCLRTFYALLRNLSRNCRLTGLELPHGIIHWLVRDMDISVHCCFDARMTEQLLQNLGLHPALDGSRGVGMPERVHAEAFDPSLITELIQMRIIRAVFGRISCTPVDKDKVAHTNPFKFLPILNPLFFSRRKKSPSRHSVL